MPEVLKFVFKGSRDYVHGTSMFNALVQAVSQRSVMEGTINISFKHKIHNPVCVLEERLPVRGDSVVAKIIGNNGDSFTLCINESSETEDIERRAFDESEVCRGAVVGAKCITQYNPHHQDLIELLVSLCKMMHQECVDGSKKWVFSRYDGQFPLPESEKVELRITKQIGTRLTCSDVIVDGLKIGEMYFS